MKALLIGFGDLGHRLAARLLQAGGWQVRGLRRSEEQMDGVETLAGDCRDPDLLDRALTGVDAVVATLTPGAFTPEAYRDSYVAGARALTNALGRAGDPPPQVIWVSSTSVYGTGAGEWVDEETPARPESFSGRHLLAAEEIISAAVPTTRVRFSGIYGPGRNRQISQVKAGKIAPATPLRWTNRIHSEDCAGVLAYLLERGRAGQAPAPLYIGTDCEPAPLHEVQRWLAAEMGVTPVVEVPPKASRANRRCSNRRLLADGYRFIYPTFREGYRALLAEA